MSEHTEQGGGEVEDTPAVVVAPEPVVVEPVVEAAPVAKADEPVVEDEPEHHPFKDAAKKFKALVNDHNFGWASKGTEVINAPEESK